MPRDQAYYEAENKIEQARRSGTKELNLSSELDTPDELRLQELPESVDELVYLQTLILSRNKLTILPNSLSNLTQLQSLQLSDNNLTALPGWLGQLTQLQSIDASRNQIATLPDSLRDLIQLQILDVSRNQLKTLPEWLGQLGQLQKLILWENELTSLPESIKQLSQLQKLYLHKNKFTEIPEWIGLLTQLDHLILSNNQLATLPGSLVNLMQLRILSIENNPLRILPKWISKLSNLVFLAATRNQLDIVPEWLGELRALEKLDLDGNNISSFPTSFGKLENLQELWIGGHMGGNPLKQLPESIRQLTKLNSLYLNQCQLESIPVWLSELSNLRTLNLDGNPLNPELAEAYKQGIPAVKAYLRAKAEAQIILNEAKLILVGEGEVGKTCLVDALLGKKWQEHPSTHGIEIQQIKVTDSETQKEITLNGWDFGGQRVYRPTHQLFFSAPAVYLVVWKPREGPQQGFVKEWIQLVKRREPSAKIIVVATHGGPQQRQPDIDRQELWDLFGKETVVDFFFVESKPDEHGNRKGIAEFKLAIARVATTLPEVGRFRACSIT